MAKNFMHENVKGRESKKSRERGKNKLKYIKKTK